VLDEAAKVNVQKQMQMDRKNAAGAARDLKKNEAIEWRDHPTLNAVTKTSIQFFERVYKFDDFMVERTQQEASLKSSATAAGVKKKIKKQQEDRDEDMSGDDEFTEEEDDEHEIGRQAAWEHTQAEQLYS